MDELAPLIPKGESKTLSYLGLGSEGNGFRSFWVPEILNYRFTKRSGHEEKILDKSASGLSWLTLNHYGALILCTKALLITDIDEEDPAILDTIEKVMAPWFTCVYRTKAGYRVLSTRPADYYEGIGELEVVLQRVNSDPKYVDMMSTQRYGRARVTPKPWRYSPGERASVCQLVKVFGLRSTISEEQSLAFHVHDNLCKVSSGASSKLV